MNHRLKANFYITAGILLAPLFLLTLLLGLHVFNPMALVFLAEFEIENRTGVPIWVTPLGAVGKAEERCTLPYSVSRFLYIDSPRRREFKIAPDDSRRFVYDWDDIQFCEILVRTEKGDYHVFSTGLHPVNDQYQRPPTNRFVISEPAALPRAEPFQLDALQRGNRKPMLLVFGALGALCPIFLILRAAREKTR